MNRRGFHLVKGKAARVHCCRMPMT